MCRKKKNRWKAKRKRRPMGRPPWSRRNENPDKSNIGNDERLEQIHLGRMRRRSGGRRGGCRFSWCSIAVEKFLELLEILFKRVEQSALVQRSGWMQQGEQHEVFHVKGLRF